MAPLFQALGIMYCQMGARRFDSGNPATCTTKDQRGLLRPQGPTCDIGAYEHPTSIGSPSTILVAGGNNQNSKSSLALQNPFQVLALDSNKSPVSGATVTFTAPISGPGGIFSDSGTNTTSSISNINGQATSAVLTLNNSLGTFSVTATVSGIGTPAKFTVNEISIMLNHQVLELIAQLRQLPAVQSILLFKKYGTLVQFLLLVELIRQQLQSPRT